MLATMDIAINRIERSKLGDLNLENIPFGKFFTDHMLEKTKFLTEGEKRGAQIYNGYKMLVIQAEESWKIWNDNFIS